MSCLGLPAQATCVFGSDTLNVSPSAVASTTVVVNTSSTTQGINTVQILATDAEVTARQSFSLTVQPLIVGASGSFSPTTSPGDATGAISIFGIPPYQPSCSGLPAGVTCSFSGQQVPYPSFTDLTLTVAVPSGIAAGSYPFTVGVVSGPQSASVPLTLNVVGFTLEAPTAATDWAPPGGSMTVSLGVLPIGPFSGTVTVECSVDFGGTCNGGSYTINGNTSVPITVSVAVPAGTSPGSHTLSITGTSGSISQSATFPFSIADYSGSLSTSALTIPAGGSGSVTATLNATAGFGGTVSFTCSGAAQISCSFAPTTVQPTGSVSQTTTITLSASSSADAAYLSGTRLLKLSLALPLGLVFGLYSKKRVRMIGSLCAMLLILVSLSTFSCGGSGSRGGGGGGSSTYAITVTATVAGTNTTRTLGTVNVTVTH